MSRNKKAEGRLRTLEDAYGCGRDHGPSLHPARDATRLAEMVSKKLDPPRQRVATLQATSGKGKLQPIREGRQTERGNGTLEEKQSRLRAFMEGNQQLLEGWEAQERRQKAKFKSRLKLAALTGHKSLEKSPKKPTPNPTLQHSLRPTPTFKPSLQPTLQPSLKHSLKHSLKSSNHFHNRGGVGASERLRSVEGQAFRYYLESLLGLMEENKQQLLESRRQIKKEMRREERQLRKDEKQELITSKRELVREIEQQLMREQHHNQQQRMEQYRRELEAELEQELSQQDKLPLHSYIAHPHPHPHPQLPSPPPQKKQEMAQHNNPEDAVGEGERVRSKSLAELCLLRNSGGTRSLQALSEREQERCIRVINQCAIGQSQRTAN